MPGRFVKLLAVPDQFAAPNELAYGNLRATVLSRDDLDDDVAAINSSVELIRRTRGGSWPAGPLTPEYNYVDLVWHECEFRDGGSFSYVVRDSDGGYLGCCYLYPMGRRAELTDELAEYDVDVSWWVTAEAYEQGWYTELYQALQQWVDRDFPFDRPYFSNAEVPA